jgi:hypothetical protein
MVMDMSAYELYDEPKEGSAVFPVKIKGGGRIWRMQICQ